MPFSTFKHGIFQHYRNRTQLLLGMHGIEGALQVGRKEKERQYCALGWNILSTYTQA